MNRVDEDKTAKSIWDMLRDDQKKSVAVQEDEQESVRTVGEGENCDASSVVTFPEPWSV